MIKKLLYIIVFIVGLLWLIGGCYGSLDAIFAGYIYEDMVISIGGVMGAGFVAILGILTMRWSYKKIKD